MGFFDRFRKTRVPSHPSTAPWPEGESLYAFIRRHLDPAKGGLVDSTMELPDAARLFKPGEARWVAGGMDGALSHHRGNDGDHEKAGHIARLLVQIAREGAPAAQRELYALLADDGVLGYLDLALEKLVAARPSIDPHLHAFVRRLATQAPDRGPVKFALALLGLIRDPQDLDVVATLGRHEDFTLFAVVALARLGENAEAELFKLAAVVHGWGRIHVVERLATSADPAIKRWLLREGYRNAIMHEYLAHVCATAGGLHEALAAEAPDSAVLEAATDLLSALITGGPAPGIDDYDHAGLVIARYLQQVVAQPRTLRRFVGVRAIRDYLAAENWDAAARQDNGWITGRREACQATADAYLNGAEWEPLIHAGLASEDAMTFSDADQAAQTLGIDPWDVHWRRLREKPRDSGRWFSVMNHATPERIATIQAFAEEHIPLDEIATGPADAMGLGPAYEHHSCLDYILQSLGRFPGYGGALILAGLRSPVVRNRHMALRALETWPSESASPEIRTALARAAREDPVDNVRAKAQAVLAAWGSA